MANNNKVLLVKPRFRQSHYDAIGGPQQGLGYISEALSTSGIENRVLDMDLDYDHNRLVREIEEYGCRWIGLSLWTYRYRDVYALISDLKHQFPEKKIVVGGPHVSTFCEKVLEDCPDIDFGVVCEGEQTIVELCKGSYPFPEIKGLLFRDGQGGVHFSGHRPFNQDIDHIAFPRYQKFELDKYGKIISIVTSRGCPYKCIFCPISNTIGRPYRYRNAQSVGDEFEYWYKRGYRDFTISDDNFTLIKDRVYTICDELDKRQLRGINISLRNGIRADRVDRVLLKRMKEVGFAYIAFGVEGGNDRILKNLRKGETLADMERAIKDACELGFMVALFFLLGSPGETEQDVQDSLKLALKYPVYDVRFYNLIPFPGTELFDWVKKNNYFLMDPEKYVNDLLSDVSHWENEPIFETPEMSREKRKELFLKANQIAKWHTLPIKRKFHRVTVAKKFERFGLSGKPALLLADMYFSKSFQKGKHALSCIKDMMG